MRIRYSTMRRTCSSVTELPILVRSASSIVGQLSIRQVRCTKRVASQKVFKDLHFTSSRNIGLENSKSVMMDLYTKRQQYNSILLCAFVEEEASQKFVNPI